MYVVHYLPRARKSLEKIPAEWRNRIILSVRNLAQDPFIGKKLNGKLKEMYSLRIWPYRIIYQVHKKELIVIVLDVGHRQGVYS